MLLKGPAPDSGVSDLSLRVPETPAGTGTIELPLMADEPGPSSALEEDATGSPPVGDEGAPADDATVLPASVASGQYVVHYATFATQPEADEMARQLQNREFPAFTQGTTFNARPAVAVRIGPYGQRAEAETVRVRASQVRGDVRPLVLVLDADDAASRQDIAVPGAVSGTAAAPSVVTTGPRSAARRPASPSPAVQQPPASTARASVAPGVATGFVVQIGAFSNAASATALQGRLRSANIPVFTDTVNTSRGRLTRVNAGPVSSRVEAERLKTRVKSAIGTDGIVRSHP